MAAASHEGRVIPLRKREMTGHTVRDFLYALDTGNVEVWWKDGRHMMVTRYTKLIPEGTTVLPYDTRAGLGLVIYPKHPIQVYDGVRGVIDLDWCLVKSWKLKKKIMRYTIKTL